MSYDITVACVLKSGGDFGPEYVERLQQGVAEYLPMPHRFVCLSDVPVPCERIPLRYGLTGWWSKLELFRLTGHTLYLDLDTVINGDLSLLADLPNEPFWMMADLNRRNTRPTSAIMKWHGDYRDILRNVYDAELSAYTRPNRWGDQAFIGERVNYSKIQGCLPPGFVVSHKWATIDQRRAASIVCYHGSPRPHETGWTV